MKDKIKVFSRKYLIGFTLGLISGSLVIVYAQTYFPSNQTAYDNSVSGMQATDVQGAIDELYKTCTEKSSGEQIIGNAGLEKDPYECRYFFTGANPNNYVTFNGETAGWRIISVECDGTIKIIRNTSIGKQNWDSSSSNDWSRPATLNTYLNDTYYNSLTSVAQSKIVTGNFGIGKVTNNNNDLADQVNDENKTKWNGKIALPTVSEYIRTNTNISQCGNLNLHNNNYSVCKNSSWMFDLTGLNLTITPESNTSLIRVFFVNSADSSKGVISSVFTNITTSYTFYPVLYLSSEVQITGGDGTKSNPFIIE